MQTVREMMTHDIEVLRTTETAADAAAYLAAHDEDAVLLCLADGRLAGRVSNRDIVAKVVAKGLDPKEVRLGAIAEPIEEGAVDIDVSVEEAVSVMCRHRRPRLPVVDCDRVVGAINQRDVARALTFQNLWAEASAAV